MALSIVNAAVGMSLFLAAQAAETRPIIDVSGAGFQSMPMAVPTIKVTKGGVAGSDVNPLANDPAMDAAGALTKVLREDLTLSGVFKVLDPAGYLPNAQKEGILLGTFPMGDWINIGASSLVKVGMAREGDQSSFEAHVFDVAQGREVLNAKYKGPKDSERRMVHRIADDIFQHYTREPGVFRTRIGAVRKFKDRKDLFLMDMDGNNGRALGLPDGLNLLPAWDVDGQGLLFTSYAKGNPDLYRVGTNGQGITKLSSRQGMNSGGSASPDGKYYAVTLSMDGNSEIYLLSKTGEIVRRLTKDPQIDSSPSWSPDSKQIAFVSARGGTPQIYVMDVEQGDKSAKRITFQGTYNQTPDWSPRGDKIAFTARDERNVFDVFVVDVATNKIDRITQDQGNNEEPSWAPNGRLMVFASTRSGTSQLWISNADGSVQRQITRETGELTTPTWGPFVKE